MKFLGIDEAGRGPVLGPLVIGICALSKTDKAWCTRNGVTDSKLVKPEKRDALALLLKERCWHAIKVIEPVEVDEAVRDRNVTLNGLEIKYMAELIAQFRNEMPDVDAEVMVDAPVRKTGPFRLLLSHLSGWTDLSSLKAENHADLNHRHVGAASIIAKSERERLMKEWQEKTAKPIGCGYAHDPLSRRYVAEAEPGDPLVRWSWKTAGTCKVKGDSLL